MTIYAGASDDPNVVGTVSFHSSSNMDFVVHGQAFHLIPMGIFTSSYIFYSPSIGRGGGTMVKWKSDGLISAGDIHCRDENETVVARFESGDFALTKSGKSEMGPAVAGG